MNPFGPEIMSLFTMMLALALWLGVLFFVIGLLLLIVRRLGRLERSVQDLAGGHVVSQTPGMDRTFVSRFLIAYFAALLILGLLFGAMFAFPVSRSLESKNVHEIPVKPLP